MIVAFTITLALIGVFVVLGVWAERKIAGFIQDRLGPVEVGYKGLLQSIADGLKLLQKEEIIPFAADKWVFLASPVIMFMATVAGFAVIPYAPNLIADATATGVFFLLSIVSLDVIGFLMAGWSSNNKYSLYGSMRAVSQIISYEVPVGLMVLAVVMINQSLSLQEISFAQGIFAKDEVYLFGLSSLGIQLNEVGGFLSWNMIQYPLLIPGLLVYFIASLAQSNRGPFDIPEAESEIVAGFQTEYAGFRWSVITLTEYVMMLLVAILGVILFLGSWNTPLPNIGSFALADWTSGNPKELSGLLWGVFWFLSKSFAWVFVQMWVRWTYPRLRVDQLMFLCWKVLIPSAFLIVLGAGVWRLLMI